MMAEQNVSVDEEPVADESEVSILTLNEVLQYEDQMMEDTAAVLGAMNDKSCSYAEGYVKRQALYSCLTCIPEAKNDPEKRAGVCLACSYHCHDGHELIELYTKRNFRCDCGNSKFDSFKCNLLEEKDPLNEENIYNQNFQGTYCVCSRPYPDPEDPISDEMIQCIVCEDWYHSRHLNIPLPLESFVEMVCFNCAGEHEFLMHYKELPINQMENLSAEDNNVGTDISIQTTSETSEIPKEVENLPQDVAPEENDENNPSDCNKPKDKAPVSTIFWSDISWRNKLCTCDICLEMYGDENVLYLVDSEDPVHLYEERGKAKTQEIIDTQDRDFMNSMDRVQLIETIAGYNELKTNLADFFKDFAEKKKVIRKEDVKEFFEEMQAKKKRRTEIPYFCR